MGATRGSSTSGSQPSDGSAADTLAILANVDWIVARLDRRGLADIDDVPVLELAKHVSVGRPAA